MTSIAFSGQNGQTLEPPGLPSLLLAVTAAAFSGAAPPCGGPDVSHLIGLAVIVVVAFVVFAVVVIVVVVVITILAIIEVVKPVVRIAIVNSRLERYDDGQVTFRYRDNKTGRTKRCILSQQDFIARLLQHVLPRSFRKVRYYGLYSSACVELLERAKLTLSPPPSAKPDDDHETTDASDGGDEDDDRCPFCGEGTMHIIATLERPPHRKQNKRKPP